MIRARAASQSPKMPNHVSSSVSAWSIRWRILFSDAPMMDEHSGRARFATWYNVEQDFNDILHLVQGMVDLDDRPAPEAPGRMDTRAALKARQERGEALTPEVLARVEQALTRADLSNLVRRQFICTLTRKLVPEPSSASCSSPSPICARPCCRGSTCCPTAGCFSI